MSKKEKRNFLSTIENLYPYIKIQRVEEILKVEADDRVIIVIDGVPSFFYIQGKGPYPLLIMLNSFKPSIPYVVIDEGAVKPIMRGADVMVPGIKELSDFNIGSVVGVMEPSKRAFIAVGKALMSSEQIKSSRKGKAIENIHYAGDKIWSLSLELARRFQK